MKEMHNIPEHPAVVSKEDCDEMRRIREETGLSYTKIGWKFSVSDSSRW